MAEKLGKSLLVMTETGLQGDMYKDARVRTEVFDSRPAANKAATELFREKIAEMGNSLLYTVFDTAYDTAPKVQCRIFGDNSEAVVIAVTEI